MKRISYIIAVISGLFLLGSCAFNDSQVRAEIEKLEAELSGYEKTVAEIQSQVNSLSSIKASSFITYLNQNKDGNYVVSYMDKGGETYTVELAVDADVVNQPIVSTKDVDGKLYWVTTDNKGGNEQFITDESGNKMLVGGTAPVITIDDNGYWAVGDSQLLGIDGKPVLATDVSNILFTKIEHNKENGLVEFSLVGGEKFSVRMYEALNIHFDAAPVVAISDYATPAVIKFELSGTDAENALVDYFTAYNMDVVVDQWSYTLTATLHEGATEGNIVMMANYGKNTVTKPIFFTYGTAEIQQPAWDSKYGSGSYVSLTGEMTEFDVNVSHNIDYTMTIADDCASWLKVSPNSKGEMVVTTHTYVADRYENPLGVYREGFITFYNKPYDVKVELKVRQMPVVEEGPSVPGISTPGQLYQFALAVNSGANISQFMNASGEVVLLNDIDVSGITDWTPIGGGLATGNPQYKNLVTPFTGIFNGQDHVISGINWTFDIDEGTTDLFGLFGALQNATVKNLTFGARGDKITLTGCPANVVACGAISGFAIDSKIENVTNYVSIELADRHAEVPGDNADGVLMMLGGIVGDIENSIIGGESKETKVTNYGNVTTGYISNLQNGGTGMNVGGIVAFADAEDHKENKIRYCYNYGGVSAPTGRGGGIIGTIGGNTAATALTTVSYCFNYGTIQDDAVGQYKGQSVDATYNLKRMGGLVGGTATNEPGILIENCENHGNVYSQMGCRTGGFVGHCQATIVGCVNKGTILGGKKIDHLAGWACGFNGGAQQIKSCAKGGRVGFWEDHGSDPTSAPAASNDNACGYKNAERFDPSTNF